MRNRRGLSAVAVVGMLAITVAACGSNVADINTKPGSGTANTVATGQSGQSGGTTTTAAPTNPLVVVDQGFTQLPPDSLGNSYVSEAAVLKWNSAKQIATEVQVTLTLSNAQGVVVNSDNETVGAILPGQTVAVTNSAQVSGAASLKVQAIVGSTPTGGASITPTIAPSGVTTSNPDGFGLQTTGTVTSTATKELQNVQAVAVYYNSNGAVIGGDSTFVNFIPAAGSTSFQISGSNNIPGWASTQVYFSISNLTIGALG